MAIPLSTYTIKGFLIFTGAFSVVMLLNIAAPLILDFVVSDVPLIYSTVASLLRPPYLYIVINCIIISIAASSKLRSRSLVNDPYSSPSPVNAPSDIEKSVMVLDGVLSKALDERILRGEEEQDGAKVFYRKEVEEEEEESRNEMMLDDGGGGRLSVAVQLRSDSMEFSALNIGEEKPLISSRFGLRKPVKANVEGGKALRVTSKQKRHDTLDSTWKAITEGRSMPLTRHLKKSDTWDVHVLPSTDKDSPPPALPPKRMMKSDTFIDATSSTTKSSPRRNLANGRIRREPSPSQDELNRRVEAFIKKFNEEMRLQRKKSLDQYRQMVYGGVH